MGLRSRVRDSLKKMITGDRPAAPAPAAPVAAPRPPVAAAPRPAAPAPPPPAAPPPAPALSAEEREKQEKIAAHFEKARKGVLRYLADKEGAVAMADMHDYSERRYFIAHQGFSRMMEGFVAEGLIDFDPTSGTARLSEKGRASLD